MSNTTLKSSAFTRISVLVFAMFFVVFSSCPVKKYIRLQLYKHKPLTESASGQYIDVKNVKDCSLLEKNKKIQVQVFYFDHATPDLSFLFFAVTLPVLFYFSRYRRTSVLFKPRPGFPHLVPIYLQVRNIQV